MDDSGLWVESVFIFVLILLGGFFAGSELAIVSLSKNRLQELLDEGNKNAKYIQHLQNSSERFLATTQVGFIITISLASVIAGATVVQWLKIALQHTPLGLIAKISGPLAVGIVVVAISYLSLILGSLVPKSLALKYSERLALIVASPIYWLSRVGQVLGRLLTASSNLILRPFKDKATFSESHISEEKIEYMLEEGAKVGVFDKTEKELIQSVFEFTDTIVKEIMVPRPNIIALDVDAPRHDIIKTVTEEGYSRLPVFQDTIDSIIGIVYAKDIISFLEYKDLIILQDIIRPPYFVPETKKISQLMREFQRQKVHLAVVINEFGNIEGIVTMEDILEEIVGEIHDEYDEVKNYYEVSSDGSLLVDALMRVDDFNLSFDAQLPEDIDYETVGGFLNAIAGHIPELGEEIEHDNFVFVVTQKDEHRVEQVRVNKNSPSANKNGNGS